MLFLVSRIIIPLLWRKYNNNNNKTKDFLRTTEKRGIRGKNYPKNKTFYHAIPNCQNGHGVDRIGTIPKNLYLTDRGICASGKGRRYRRTLEFFEGGKFVFLGEGWPKNETIDRSFRSSEPFRCFVV